MIERLTRNAGWKLFSLLVSLLLWFAFARDPEVGAFVAVPVEYRGMPDDLVGLVVYLASDASHYLTGQVIAHDGGWDAVVA